MAEPTPDLDPLVYAVERARLPLTVGVVVAGATIALGYLLGLVRGPLVAVVGGIALMTLGRGLGRGRGESPLLSASFVILAGAWSLPAVRWSSLMLDDLRGAQGVLGQTLLVGSRDVVTGLALAAGASVVALAVWAASPPITGRGVWVRGGEALPAALASTTVFWGSAPASGQRGGVGGWALSIALVMLVAVAGAALFRGRTVRWVALAVATSALVIGAGYLARGL